MCVLLEDVNNTPHNDDLSPCINRYDANTYLIDARCSLPFLAQSKTKRVFYWGGRVSVCFWGERTNAKFLNSLNMILLKLHNILKD